MRTGTFLGVTGPQTEKNRGELDRNPLINNKMERETSGATFAENGCAENKKPLNQQGFIVFGAGNQVRTGDLYLGKVPVMIFSIM